MALVIPATRLWTLRKPVTMKRALAIVVTTSLATMAIIWLTFGPTYVSRNFVITMQIAYSGDYYTSSSVWNVSNALSLSFYSAGATNRNIFKGEALVFDIKDGQRLIALRRRSLSAKVGGFSGLLNQCLPPSRDDRAYMINLMVTPFDCTVRPMQFAIIRFPKPDSTGRLIVEPIADQVATVTSIRISATNEAVSYVMRDLIPWMADKPVKFDITDNRFRGSYRWDHFYVSDFTTGQ